MRTYDFFVGSVSWGNACWGLCFLGVDVGKGVGVGVKRVEGGCQGGRGP